jgi:hypothetical protein
MNAGEVTLDEIGKLPHQSKIAFAARCARIVLDEPALRPWPNAHAVVADALVAAEHWGGQCTVPDQEKDHLRRQAGELRTHAAAWAGSAEGEDAAVARAVCAALEVAISANDRAGGDREAADRAYEAYKQAHHAAEVCHYEPFPVRAREALDAMIAHFRDNDVPSGAFALGIFHPG